jgi:hypothetical protein
VANQLWIRANASPFTIQAAVFVLVIVFVAAKSGLSGKGTKGMLSPIELVAYSFFNAALILSAVFSFMDPQMRQVFQETSRMANFLISYRIFWILAPVILMIATGGLRRTHSSSYD